MATRTLVRELGALLGDEAVLPDPPAAYLEDATSSRGVRGFADAVALPSTADEVARVVGWCYEHDVPIVPRGGGTGFAGGAVPFGGVVLALERMTRVRSFDPLLWRIEVESGVTTWRLRGLARESGLVFPPDPGAGEQSQVGGNVATNAGGPHAFKYGVVGRWVTGLEVVLPPGEVVRTGGAIRKDTAGYDLKSLLVGSEGTLGVVTAVSLRLLPAPERVLPVVAAYGSPEAGCTAIEAVYGAGIQAAAVEFLDAGALRHAGASFPAALPPGSRFLVVAEADGSAAEAERVAEELVEALSPGALALHRPPPADVWRWRDGVSLAVTAALGRKLSEDVAVPVERLCEMIAATVEIGARHGLEGCSWGHAGDGNVHASFLFAPDDEGALSAAVSAGHELAARAVALGGTISAEHGVGLLKLPHLRQQLGPRSLALQREIKRVFDPKGLLNPGKKVPPET
jgi:glycolate oxidase subunit GlcD